MIGYFLLVWELLTDVPVAHPDHGCVFQSAGENKVCIIEPQSIMSFIYRSDAVKVDSSAIQPLFREEAEARPEVP